LLVHHTNKEDGVLGSISIPGGADAVIIVSPDGHQIGVHCDKLKDFDEFPDFNLVALPVEVDADPLHNSLILVPGEVELLDSERTALKALVATGVNGLTATDWARAASGPNLKERNFYKVRGRLEERGFIRLTSVGRSDKYIVSEMGHYALNHATVPTALVLHSGQVQEVEEGHIYNATPPLGGGCSYNSPHFRGIGSDHHCTEPTSEKCSKV
jgi:hypothetical protein